MLLHFFMFTFTGVIARPGPQVDATASPRPYDQYECTQPEITNAAIDTTIRWNSVNTEDGWTAAVASWTSNRNTGLSFAQQISNFFHGPEQVHCEQTSARDGCSSSKECSDVNHPAGFLILNSLVAVSNLHYNLYDAISKAEGDVNTLIGSFASTFAPIEDKEEGLKILLDFVGLGFALIASPVWNLAFKNAPFFKDKGDELGTIKDSVNPLVSNGVTISKDASLGGQSLTVMNTLDANLRQLVQHWSTSVDHANKALFDGSDKSIQLLHDTTTQGKVLDASFGVDTATVQTAIETAIFGYLIPQAWRLSNKDLHPVVIDDNIPCETDSILKNNQICYNQKKYSLMSVSKGQHCITRKDGLDCNTAFSPLPGLDSLNGGQWGNIKIDDLIAGAVNTFKNAHKVVDAIAGTVNAFIKGINGAPEIDATTATALNDIFDSGIRAPGIIQIPVCSTEEVDVNWGKSDNTNPNYPCN